MKTVLAAGAVLLVALTYGVAVPGPAMATVADPGMIEALRRDLNLSERQVTVLLERQQEAMRQQRRLRSELGDRYAGAWMSEVEGRLVVGVTDAGEAAARVRAAGAQPRVVALSERDLGATLAKLDATVARQGVSSWYVDVMNNTVVVEEYRAGAAASLVKAAGLDPAAVRVRTASAAPQPLHDLRGGDRFGVPGGSCSIGFSIRQVVAGDDPPGFVTAGHCLAVGDPTTGFNGQAQGITRGSVFPGTGDYAWALVNNNWTPRPWVNRYGAANRLVHGATPAPVNTPVCRSGFASGWKCGVVRALNTTVNYEQGPVTGLTRTDACADFGDSGGSFIAVTQAQGVTSGGVVADCTIYFQPVQEILDAFSLRLVTTALPQIINLVCEYGGNAMYTCDLSYASPAAATIRWTVNGTGRSDWNDDTHVRGGCALNTTVTVRAAVTNPAGSAELSDSFRCEGEPQ